MSLQGKMLRVCCFFKYKRGGVSSSQHVNSRTHTQPILRVIKHTDIIYLSSKLKNCNLRVHTEPLMLYRTVRYYIEICDTHTHTYATLDHKTSLQSLGHIFSNSQKYIVWVKIIHFYFMPKIIRILSKDHVP